LWDPITHQVPITLLCSQAEINAARFGTGLCSNANSPGFYAVLYFDNTLNFPFRLFTPSSHDYGSTTEFYVYTTTGYLQQVNTNAVVFTTRPDFDTNLAIQSTYSHILGEAPSSTNSHSGYLGDMSCEKTAIGQNGALDCFNKGDWAMFIDNRKTTNSIAANPIYPNMYQIAKIWEKPSINPNSTDIPKSLYDISRLQIVLDYSMNAKFNYADGSGGANSGVATDTTAFAYKFHAPTNANGGYQYVSTCSGRGICNSEDGVCECFKGYSGDNCNCMNSFSV